MSANNTPDLASVLKTLAGLTPQSQRQGHATNYVHQQAPSQTWQQNAPAYTNATPASSTKVIDPATIIDWSAGLRCVMKTVAKHEDILHDIRRVRCLVLVNQSIAYSLQMIKVQHEHEEQWWRGREALKKTQEARKEGQKKLDEVL
jgi:hypothetical protein